MATDNLRLRIAKKAYVFGIRKKFAYRQYFTPKKKEEFELSKIRGMLKRAAKEGEGKGGQKSRMDYARSALRIASIAIAVILFLSLGLWLYLSSLPPVVQPPEIRPVVPAYEISFGAPEVLNIGGEGDLEYALRSEMSYSAKNVSSIDLRIDAYADRVPTQVFVLDYPRQSADSFFEFREALSEELSRLGIVVTDIDMEGLARAAPGAAVVIPTGYVPAPLIGMEEGTPYPDIVERGVTLIYIGLPWNRNAITARGELVPVSRPDPYGLSFSSRVRAETAPDFSLYEPQYSAEGRGGRILSSGSFYGSSSFVKMGQGYVLFLPQSLDGGWRGNGTLAGRDVARVVFQMPHMAPLVRGRLLLNITENTSSGAAESFVMPVSRPLSYVRFFANVTDAAGGWRGVSGFERAQKAFSSDIFMSRPNNTVVPTSITDQKVRMNIDLRENTSRGEKLYLQTFARGMVIKSEEIEQGITPLNSRKSFDYDASLSAGEYVLRVSDSGGNAYASAFLRVSDIEVMILKEGWKEGEFEFKLVGPEGAAVSGKKVIVSMDGKNEREFKFADVISYNVTAPESGEHTFRFRVGGTVKTLTRPYNVTKPPWENPLVIFLAIMAAAAAGVGMYLSKPEKQLFALDIPDFPPMSQIKIPVGRATVLEIFEQVNKDYSWSTMPLRLEEVKAGFRKLTYNGKPILIGDYNLERLLDSLERGGALKSSRGFWGLSKWEKESGYSMFYLSMYRQMRDVFVNNAVRFTKLGAGDDYDVLVDIRKGGAYIQIYENESAVSRALSSAKSGPTIIVFADEDGLEQFHSLLVSTSAAAVSLKVHIDNGTVAATSISNLEKLVRELRGG